MILNHRSSIAILPLALLTACGSSYTTGNTGGTGSSPPATSPSASTAAQGTSVVATGTVTISGASKTVLTDTAGMTLYYRTDEGPTTIKCTGGCATNWPPLTLASGDPSSSSSLTGSLTTYTGANGRQVLYNGHPLYRFASDGAPGQARGQGLLGIWFVVTPDLPAAQ